MRNKKLKKLHLYIWRGLHMNVIKNIFLVIALCVVNIPITTHTSYRGGLVEGAVMGLCLGGGPALIGIGFYNWYEAGRRYNKASTLLREYPLNKDINNRSLSYIQSLIKDEPQMALYLHQMAQYNGALYDKQSACEDIASAQSYIRWGSVSIPVGLAVFYGFNFNLNIWSSRTAVDRPDAAP